MDFEESEENIKEMLFRLTDLQKNAWRVGFERGRIEGRRELEKELKEKERKEIEKAKAENSFENENE